MGSTVEPGLTSCQATPRLHITRTEQVLELVLDCQVLTGLLNATSRHHIPQSRTAQSPRLCSCTIRLLSSSSPRRCTTICAAARHGRSNSEGRPHYTTCSITITLSVVWYSLPHGHGVPRHCWRRADTTRIMIHAISCSLPLPLLDCSAHSQRVLRHSALSLWGYSIRAVHETSSS